MKYIVNLPNKIIQYARATFCQELKSVCFSLYVRQGWPRNTGVVFPVRYFLVFPMEILSTSGQYWEIPENIIKIKITS